MLAVLVLGQLQELLVQAQAPQPAAVAAPVPWQTTMAAFGTVASATLAAGVVVVSSRRERTARKDRDDLATKQAATERRRPASLVSAWVEEGYLPNPDGRTYTRGAIVHIANEGDQPMFDVSVAVGVDAGFLPGLLRRNALPTLGHLALGEVSPLGLTKLYGQLLSTGRHDGRGGLSARSVRYLHTVLRKAFADAVRWRYLAVNPCDAASPPSASAARAPQMRTWTVEQLRAFLAFTARDEHAIGYLLAAACGLRRGELLGLRWTDVELDPARGGPALRIRQQLVEVAYTLSFAEPKTAAGRRTVALDPATADALRRHALRQRGQRLALGATVGQDDLVVARADGSPCQPTNFGQAFANRMHASGLPYIRLHDLRHTHASLALQAGIHPKIVSERLGHASTAFTLDTYSHAVPSLQAEAAQAIGRLLAPPPFPPEDTTGAVTAAPRPAAGP